MNGKVALVTGATRGIGAAIAHALAEAGCRVVGTATSVEGAGKISAALEGRGRGVVLDVTDGAAIEAVLRDIETHEGHVSILVNNAGITRDMLLMRMKDEDWDAVHETNLKAIFRLCRAVSRGMMKARWGRIVNIGSVVGTMGNAGQANYAAAKAGLIGLTKALAVELGSRGVTVNVVAPGFIDTDMTRALPEAQRTQLSERIPVGRLGQPEDVAYAVRFLCDERASYVTGVTLHVNGGLYMA
ncbi:MAG: 3-oxoacyl-ACP reductase FabG [Casimicrobiaceae bacterium]|nr:3-oxoacyl-ACP reductase FabG [Casimicrobiaceae bacterium]MDW8312817.1 3-oxoacyl-ACP reductase FabG [Burkholderiales bacterium]